MMGKVLGFTQSTRTGTITGADGLRYGFRHSEWRSDDPIGVGVTVDFESRGEEAFGIYPIKAPATPDAGTVFLTALARIRRRLRRPR